MGFSPSGAELKPRPDSSPQISETQFVDSPDGWKQEANHRLAAHRARRSRHPLLHTTLPGMGDAEEPAAAIPAAARNIAARVAERYAKAPTYSEILASEARNAARAAQAAAVAACDARDAAEAILVGLDVGLNVGPNVALDGEPGSSAYEDSALREPASLGANRAKAFGSQDGEQSQPGSRGFPGRESSTFSRPLPAIVEAIEEEASEEYLPAPIQPLPAKLLEFPRELVAARKARPRLVEGPLREEYDRDGRQSQLRIFEVESESISTEPAAEAELSGWSAIRLDSPARPQMNRPAFDQNAPDPTNLDQTSRRSPASKDLSSDVLSSRQKAASGFDLPLQIASLEDRLMAAVVDAALAIGGFLVFLLVFAACTAHPPVGRPAATGAGVALFAFGLIYQILFFSFGQDTPGMRYAKVALCTFDDENPTRKALRRRIVALLLAACPLGIGLLWAFFDDDRLGWHDRISRTYQRSYR